MSDAPTFPTLSQNSKVQTDGWTWANLNAPFKYRSVKPVTKFYHVAFIPLIYSFFHCNSLGKMITLYSTTKKKLQIDCFTIDQNDKLMNLDD